MCPDSRMKRCFRMEPRSHPVSMRNPHDREKRASRVAHRVLNAALIMRRFIWLLAVVACAKARHVEVTLGPTTESLVRSVRDEVRASDEARQKSLDTELGKLTSAKYKKLVDATRTTVDDKALFARIPDGSTHQPKLQHVQTLLEQSVDYARDKKYAELLDAAVEAFGIADTEDVSLNGLGDKAYKSGVAANWAEDFNTAGVLLDHERVYFSLSQLAGILRDEHADGLDVLARFGPTKVRMDAFRRIVEVRKAVPKDSLLAPVRLDVMLLWSYRAEIDSENEKAMLSTLKELGLQDKIGARVAQAERIPIGSLGKSDAGLP